MSAKSARRRSPPVVIWFVLGIVAIATLFSATLALFAWYEARQVQMLQAEVDALQAERKTSETEMIALQSTATAMEGRLTTLEENDLDQQLALLQATVETANDSQQIADLQASLAEIQARVDRFQIALDGLSTRIETLQRTYNPAGKALPAEVRLAVARQKQGHSLSCESSAASMAAQYLGVDLSEAEVLAALPLDDNPYLGFRGNVDGPPGGIEDYGVYAGPILEILNNWGLQAHSIEGGLGGIKAAIARGNPVIAWVTYDCLARTPVEAIIDGETVTLVPYQHAVVVSGYNDEGVWANDPWDGLEDFYPTQDFVRALGYFGDMAIEVAAP
jgi:uncharacterized protein YvpB